MGSLFKNEGEPGKTPAMGVAKRAAGLLNRFHSKLSVEATEQALRPPELSTRAKQGARDCLEVGPGRRDLLVCRTTVGKNDARSLPTNPT